MKGQKIGDDGRAVNPASLITAYLFLAIRDFLTDSDRDL